MECNKKLLFWGELPPDVFHGISLSNERILSILKEIYTIDVVRDNACFGSSAWKIYSFISALFKIVCKSFKKPDIYYLNLPLSYLGLCKVLISIYLVKMICPKVNVVTHLHRGDFLEFIEHKKQRHLLCNVLKCVTAVIVLSETSASELVTSGLIDKEKINIIYNSINVISPKNNIEIAVDINKSVKYLFCLSNYIPTKRIHSLVEVVNKLNLITVRFNGAKSSEEYMRYLVSKDTQSICNFGSVIEGKEKEKQLNSAIALVLPSLNEGMPLVILESLAQGTPVICFNIGFISDYLGKDYPGLINELTDVGLFKKIEWLLTLPNTEYESLCKLSFSIFWDRYNQDIIKSTTLNKFDKFGSSNFN
jgi:glycosyltransferase involved in cell wall biosynthesis